MMALMMHHDDQADYRRCGSAAIPALIGTIFNRTAFAGKNIVQYRAGRLLMETCEFWVSGGSINYDHTSAAVKTDS
jgi:hypothetical protein